MATTIVFFFQIILLRGVISCSTYGEECIDEPASGLNLVVNSCEENGSVTFTSSGILTSLVYTCYNSSNDPATTLGEVVFAEFINKGQSTELFTNLPISEQVYCIFGGCTYLSDVQCWLFHQKLHTCLIEQPSSTFSSTTSVHTTVVFSISTVDSATNLLVHTTASYQDSSKFTSDIVPSISSPNPPLRDDRLIILTSIVMMVLVLGSLATIVIATGLFILHSRRCKTRLDFAGECKGTTYKMYLTNEFLQVNQLSKSTMTIVEPLYDISSVTYMYNDVTTENSIADSVSLVTEIAVPFHVTCDSESDDCNSGQFCHLCLKPSQCLELEAQPVKGNNISSHDCISGLDKDIATHSSTSDRESSGSIGGYIQHKMTADVTQANTNDKSDISNVSTTVVGDTASIEQFSLNQTAQQSLSNPLQDFEDDHNYEICSVKETVMKLIPMTSESDTTKPHQSCPVDKSNMPTLATESSHSCKQVPDSSSSADYISGSNRESLPSNMPKTKIGLKLCPENLPKVDDCVKTQELFNLPTITSDYDSHMESSEMCDDDDYVDCTMSQKD